MATSTATLYPKITNHIIDMVKILKESNRNPENPEEDVVLYPIPVIGTVKLHGTHADILIHSDNRIVFQSRNIVGLQITRDNAGFATFMSRKSKPLLRLRDLILARFTQLHPNTPISSTAPVVVAGEWVGTNIQKDVAVSRLSKRFVIISISINGTWQPDTDYSFIMLPNHAIYNISRAGIFTHTLYPFDLERTTTELGLLADKVATQCPFAATFGLTGEGEGIVWKPAAQPYNSNPALWFKTKGGRFKPTFAARPACRQRESAEQKRDAAAEVAKVWTSVARMEQGLGYLEECGVKRDIRGLTTFLKWVQGDVLGEEQSCIKEWGIDVASLKIEVAKIARGWYREQMER